MSFDHCFVAFATVAIHPSLPLYFLYIFFNLSYPSLLPFFFPRSFSLCLSACLSVCLSLSSPSLSPFLPISLPSLFRSLSPPSPFFSRSLLLFLSFPSPPSPSSQWLSLCICLYRSVSVCLPAPLSLPTWDQPDRQTLRRGFQLEHYTYYTHLRVAATRHPYLDGAPRRTKQK